MENPNTSIGSLPGDTRLHLAMRAYSVGESGLAIRIVRPARSEQDEARLIELVKSYARCGDNPNAFNRVFQSPLDIELQSPVWSKRVASAFLEVGADVNLRDTDGSTPLIRTCGYPDYFAKASFLMEHGADVNAATVKEYTPVSCALATGNTHALRLFVRANPRTKDGDTPLHLVKTVENARRIVAAGADINARNGRGETALDRLARVASEANGRYREDILDVVEFLRRVNE